MMTINFNSADFNRQLMAFVELCYAREALLYRRVVNHVKKSILDGSEITGAPGQPWEWGDLYKSWIEEGSFEQRIIQFVSYLIYAPIIEDNWREAELRSAVGGFHSVKMTNNAFVPLVAHELEIVKRAIPDGRGVGSTWRDPRTGRFV